MTQCAFCQKWGECTQDYFENIPICDECAKEVARALIRDGKESLVGPELLKELKDERHRPQKV